MVLSEAAVTNRRFAPGWPLWVFTLSLLPVLLGLGVSSSLIQVALGALIIVLVSVYGREATMRDRI